MAGREIPEAMEVASSLVPWKGTRSLIYGYVLLYRLVSCYVASHV